MRTWRNGRRKGLKIPRKKFHPGSKSGRPHQLSGALDYAVVPAKLPAITKLAWRLPVGCELFHAPIQTFSRDRMPASSLELRQGRATIIISALALAPFAALQRQGR